jgi:hypothetical protein
MKKMVDSSLNNYVSAQLQRGYAPEAIRTALLQAGYNPQDIEFALRVSSRPPERKVQISGRTMIFLLAGILAIVLLVFAGILVFMPSAKQIQIAPMLDKTQYLPGETIEITTQLSSEQSRKVPVSLDYVVIDPVTQRTLTSRSGQIDVGSSAVDMQSITLPESTAPGEYELRIKAMFESISRVISVRFTVLQPAPVVVPTEQAPAETVTEPAPIETPSEELQCSDNCDDLNPATEDSCVRGSCVHTIKTDFCGNGICETGEDRANCAEDCGGSQNKEEVTQQALKIAKTDPEKAATLCTGLVIPEAADPCFAAIANESKKSALCGSIQDSRARDNCLMEFAFANDYTVCDKLSNRYLLTSCQSLARFSTIQQEQEESNNTQPVEAV